MDGPTSSYATASIALRVSGALEPPHHDKVETPSVGTVVFCIHFFAYSLLFSSGIHFAPHSYESHTDYVSN
jgi:hypothetical protein